MKFSTKLLLLCLSSILGITLPLSGFLYYSGMQATETQIKAHLQERAVHLMDKIEGMLWERVGDIQVLALDPLMTNPLASPQAITQRLLDYRNHYQFYLALAVFDANRLKVADTSGLGIGKPVENWHWVPEVFEQGQMSIDADLHFSQDLHLDVIVFAAPVRNKAGQIKGAVVAYISPEIIYQILKPPSDHTRVVLLNERGKVIYSNHQRLITNLQIDSVEQLPLIFGEQAFYTMIRHLSQQVPRWTLILYYPMDIAFAPSITLRNHALLVGIGLLVVALGSIFMVSKKIVYPVLLLRDAALKLGQGDFNAVVPVLSQDEIGQLAKTFNQMASLIEEYQSTLERKVEERTQELNAKNALLQKEQDKFTTVLDSLEAAVYVVDLATQTVLFANRYTKQLSSDEAQTQLLPDQPLAAIGTWELFNQAHWYYLRNREIYWPDSRLVQLIIATDITERKQMETALQLTQFSVDKSADAIFWIREDASFLYVNDAACRTLEYSREELLTLTVFEVDTQVLNREIWKFHWQQLKQRGALTIESCHRTKSGTLFPVEISINYLEFNHVEYNFAFARNIASRKQAEQELLLAKEAAETANHAKSAFLANMSHELRTPLNSILGYTQILTRDRNLMPDQQEGINIIQRSGEYLLTLINDVLDLSKIEAGRIELYPIDFNLSEFIRGLTDLFKLRAYQKGLTFVYESLSPLPLVIHADDKRLRQILINLLGNAFKFTHQGQVSLTIGYQAGFMRFQVVDTGIGIAAADLEKIFLPFQQVGDKQYQAQGTGLGLPITKKLVEMMQGKISVESCLGQGSTFWMELPLAEVSSCVKASSASEWQVIGFKEAPRKILVIDDQRENRFVMIHLLTPLGFQVSEAKNGQEGLGKVMEFSPDLVITDLVMPVMDGFELTRQLRSLAEFRNLPIIASSASVFDRHKQASLAAGCNAFLPKPFQTESLLELLQELLNLTWIYEERPVSLNNLIKQGPSPQQATTLFELAKIGDIMGILDFVTYLEKADEGLKPFVSQVRQLAKDFEDEKICHLVERYRSS